MIKREAEALYRQIRTYEGPIEGMWLVSPVPASQPVGWWPYPKITEGTEWYLQFDAPSGESVEIRSLAEWEAYRQRQAREMADA